MSVNIVFSFVALWMVIVSPAGAQTASGDLFVSTDEDGARILVDDGPTGQMTPAMIRDVSVGSHQVTIETDCGTSSQIVEIEENVITRAELQVCQQQTR